MEPLLCCDCLVQITQLKPAGSGISMVKGLQLFSHTSTFDLFNGRGLAWEQVRSLVLHLAHDPVAQTNIRNSFTAPDPSIHC